MQRLVSATHHIVIQDSDSLLMMKKAGSHPHAVEELTREYEVLQLLGRPVSWKDDGFYMPYLGSPLTSWDEDSIQEIREQIKDFSRLEVSETGDVPGAEWWPSIVRVKIAYRCGTNSELREKLIAKTVVPDTVRLEMAGRALVNTDIHTGNVLRYAENDLVIIDWESAYRGNPKITTGCFDLALTIAGTSIPASTDVVVQYARRVKAASVASWSYADLLRKGRSVEEATAAAEICLNAGL